MRIESDSNGLTIVWFSLLTLLIIVEEADDNDNENIFYDGKSIIIRDIPSLTKHGTDFCREGMRSRLLGLAARCTDENGMYIVHVLVTHDLNSCTIGDVQKLLSVITEY